MTAVAVVVMVVVVWFLCMWCGDDTWAADYHCTPFACAILAWPQTVPKRTHSTVRRSLWKVCGAVGACPLDNVVHMHSCVFCRVVAVCLRDVCVAI